MRYLLIVTIYVTVSLNRRELQKHSMRVTKRWRLVFAWSGDRGEAKDIYLDNHDYR